MTRPRAQYLLATLLALLATHGLGAEGLDAWRGWVVFKQFARQVAEQPDFDYPHFDRFVDAVEPHPDFGDLLVDRPTTSDVHWEDA